MNTQLSEPYLTEVQDILIEELGVKRDQLTRDARLEEDLGADSLVKVEIAMRIEDEFELTIADEALENISTVGSVLDVVAKALNAPADPRLRKP